MNAPTTRAATVGLVAALGMAGCGSDSGGGQGSSSSSSPAIKVLPAAAGQWAGRGGSWRADTPGWAPFRGARPVEDGGKVWYLTVTPAGKMGLATFAARNPGKVQVKPLPWDPADSDDFRYRLTITSGRPVVVYDLSDDATPQLQAVTADPKSGDISKPAGHPVETADPVDYWSAASAGDIVQGKAGPLVRYSPTTRRWQESPAPAHGGTVLTTIGSTPVEWVSPDSYTGAGSLYVGGKKTDLQLHPAPDPTGSGSSTPTATDVVRPVAATDAWALLAVQTTDPNTSDTSGRDTRLVLVRPGGATSEPVQLDRPSPFTTEWRSWELGDARSGSAGRVGAANAGGQCITVTPGGKVTKATYPGTGAALAAVTGQAAYLSATPGDDQQPAAMTCRVGAAGKPRVQQNTVPPVLVTQSGLALFQSQPKPANKALDQLVAVTSGRK